MKNKKMDINEIAKILGKHNMKIPENYKHEPVEKLENVQAVYNRYCNDSKGGGGKFFECILRYVLTGILESVHPLGKADIVITSGITTESKTGHGWALEPCFDTLEDLCDWLESRTNIMLRASHVAYLPYRANFEPEQIYVCLFFSARKFVKIMSRHGRLEVKKNRELWGIAIKPWICEGYAQRNSKPKDAEIRAELVNEGIILEEFAEKFGITLHSLDNIR